MNEYEFEITGVKKVETNDSRIAVVDFKILLTDNPEEDGIPYRTIEAQDFFYLTKKAMPKLFRFFKSIGFEEFDHQIKMDWDNLIGKRGYCDFVYHGGGYFEISQYYDAEETID